MLMRWGSVVPVRSIASLPVRRLIVPSCHVGCHIHHGRDRGHVLRDPEGEEEEARKLRDLWSSVHIEANSWRSRTPRDCSMV